MQGLHRGKTRRSSPTDHRIRKDSVYQQFHRNISAHRLTSVREPSVCSTTQQQGGEECYSCHIISPCAHISKVLSLGSFTVRLRWSLSHLDSYQLSVWSQIIHRKVDQYEVNRDQIAHKTIQLLSLIKWNDIADNDPHHQCLPTRQLTRYSGMLLYAKRSQYGREPLAPGKDEEQVTQTWWAHFSLTLQLFSCNQ